MHSDCNGVYAIYKPAGMLSHPNKPGDAAIVTAPYCMKSESFNLQTRQLHLLNRLDSATSGVLLLCDNKGVATTIRELFARRQVRKSYIALVLGLCAKHSLTWHDTMKKVSHDNTIRAVAGGAAISTSLTALAHFHFPHFPPCSLVRLIPHTGRTHQLRYQCSLHQHPIVGDNTYGDFRFNKQFVKLGKSKRLFLHSHEISFEYEYNGATHHFAAHSDIPDEFPLS